MSKKSKKTPPAPPAPEEPKVRVAKGDGIALPKRAAPMESAGGVAAGMRQQLKIGEGKRKMPGHSAAEASKLFPRGGEAFMQWLQRRKGIGLAERRTEAEWQTLVTEFADRPIHGHRRG